MRSKKSSLEQQIRQVVTQHLNVNEYGEQMRCLNANDVESLIQTLIEIALPKE